MVRSVLVIGGGIAGMCAAIELRKRGIEVDLIEVDPEWRVYGAGITISAPSLRAFQRIGVVDAILSQGAASDGLDLFLANGTPLASIPALPAAGSTIAASAGIVRPVLARILAEATRAAGVNVRLGTTFSSLVCADDDVAVAMTDGTARRYDLVLGADGINSKVRTTLFPDAPQPRYTGQVCWRAVVPRPASIRRAAMYIGRQIKAGIVPVSKDEMYLFFLETRATPEHIDAARWPELLRKALAEFTGPVAAIRDGLGADSRIVYRPLFALMMPRPWHRGRAVLLGDAAHATTPHLASGAGLAVEDALVLAEELERASSCEEALHRFTERRYERCRLVVESSVRLGEIEQGGGSPQEHEQLMRESTGALAAAI
ncbi:MAG TPA: FAD-dependent oxidoreductase [Steroidobacteraceae bacterium]|jgi:2-polyprenyl-6-methoxyphenol hydroxylase-like FAD-dependent oxidoreductase|nr:FAD-dependent oxidoreductase [Steroidobacteraceae bacterium]